MVRHEMHPINSCEPLCRGIKFGKGEEKVWSVTFIFDLLRRIGIKDEKKKEERLRLCLQEGRGNQKMRR